MTKVLGDNPFASPEAEQEEEAPEGRKAKAKAPRKPAARQEGKPAAKKVAAKKTSPKKAPPKRVPTKKAPPTKKALVAESVSEVIEAPPAPEPASEPAPQPVAEQAPAAPPTASQAAPAPPVPRTTALVTTPRHPAAEPSPPRRPAPLSFLSRRIRDLAMRSRSRSVDEFGLDRLAADRIDPFLHFLYGTYFRVEVSGLDHIPDTGRAMIVANHSGVLPYDSAMLMHAVRHDHPVHRTVRPLLEDFVFHFPYLGPLLNRIGGVRACQENAERLLLSEQLVAVFPEGIKGTGKLYSERYKLQRFGRGGFVKLALRTGAPIIPAAIVGAEETQPMLGRLGWLARPLGVPYVPITPTFPWLGPLGLLPFPIKWHIAFGQPLDFAQGMAQGEAEDRVLIHHLAGQVRQKIQEMINDLLGRRRSVIFG